MKESGFYSLGPFPEQREIVRYLFFVRGVAWAKLCFRVVIRNKGGQIGTGE